MFKYILYLLNFAKTDWIANEDNLEWNEFHSEVFLIRIAFFCVMFLINMPFMFIQKISAQNLISVFFLGTLLFMALYLTIESPYRYVNQKQELYEFHPGIKTLGWDKIPLLFSVLVTFYVQPFVLSLKKEMINPTLDRLSIVYVTSGIIEICLFIVFGSIAYSCYGDKLVPELLMLRPQLENSNLT